MEEEKRGKLERKWNKNIEYKRKRRHLRAWNLLIWRSDKDEEREFQRISEEQKDLVKRKMDKRWNKRRHNIENGGWIYLKTDKRR